ncbi:MAG: DUF1707 domain-containing protein [Streptosporangiaceae bacterium]|jgi:hypothetical protein
MATGYNLRVGDADREAVAAQLREHFADGRLTLDELNERLDQAFAAKTGADLNTVLRDLPHATPSGPQVPGWQGSAWPVPSQPSWDDRSGNSDQRAGSRRPFAAIAPLMGLVWLFIIMGAFSLFGLGGGGRPFAIVLFLAALGLFRRLLGMGKRRGMGGPRGPRGPKGPRRW